MPKVHSRDEDLGLLRILDMHYGDGLTYAQIAARTGQSRSAVASKICNVTRAALDCRAERPENRDGGLPRRWWAT